MLEWQHDETDDKYILDAGVYRAAVCQVVDAVWRASVFLPFQHRHSSTHMLPTMKAAGAWGSTALANRAARRIQDGLA